MSSHFLFHSNASEVVPFNARYSFPTQASRVIQSTVKIPPRSGSQMGAAGAPLTSSAKGRLIQITLPAQGYLNPLESYLRFDLGLTTNSSGTTVTQNCVRNLNSIHTMFRRLRVMYGSLVIEDIQNYGALVRMMTNVAVEGEYQRNMGAVLEGMGSDAARASLWNDVQRGPPTTGALTGVPIPGAGTSGNINFGNNTVIPGPTQINTSGGVAIVNGTTTITQSSAGQGGLQTHTFCIQLASGLLTQQKLIPLKWLANQLTIELELDEPAAFLVTGSTAEVVSSAGAGAAAYSDETVPSLYTTVAVQSGSSVPSLTADTTNQSALAYYLDNISFVANILEFDSTYDAAFYQGMLAGGVPIKFASWHTHQHVPTGSQTILTIQERARSVKSAFAVIRKRADLDSTNLQRDPYWSYPGVATAATGANTYWTERTGALDEFQWRIGGRYFPSQPVKCLNGGAEPLMELTKALNVLGDYSIGAAVSPQTWFKPRGVFTIATEFESTNGMELSGINAEELADLALVLKLYGNVSFSGADTDLYVNTFIHYDSMLIIRPNNVVELIQ